MAYEGIVNVLKPPGMTSSDAVADLRHIYKLKRVGHTGTLDPGAAGVLPICLGRATRLFDYLVDKDKEYILELCFGAETDTQDSYGAVTAQSEASVAEAKLAAVLPQFLGAQEQIAPMYSAVRLDGKKLYQLARSGAQAVEKRRGIVVHAMELLQRTGENRFLLRVVCSRGTYVRTLCQDIGRRLGVPAHLSFLLRTRSGLFCVEHAYSIAELRQAAEEGTLQDTIVPIETGLSMLGEARLDGLSGRQLRLLLNGAPIAPAGWETLAKDTPLRTYANGEFLGIGLADAEGIHIHTYLREETQDEQ